MVRTVTSAVTPLLPPHFLSGPGVPPAGAFFIWPLEISAGVIPVTEHRRAFR